MTLRVKAVLIIFSCFYTIVTSLHIYTYQQCLKVVFLDIGQGDAALIITPDMKSILIDTGRDVATVSAISNYWKSSYIDLLIITHPDTDHLAGVYNLRKSFHFNKVIAERNTLLDDLDFIEVNDFDVLRIGCCTSIKLFNTHNKSDDSNERSIAALISYGDNDIFIAGDLPKNLEDSLAMDLGDIEMLKVGHHGSKTSTSQYFLETVKPEIAIISVGKENDYGHPHIETMQLLSKNKIKSYRTDLQGDIQFKIEANNPAIIFSQ